MVDLCTGKLIDLARKLFYARTVFWVQINKINFAACADFPEITEDRAENFRTEWVVQVNHQVFGGKPIVRRIRVHHFCPTAETFDVPARRFHEFSSKLNADQPFERET